MSSRETGKQIAARLMGEAKGQPVPDYVGLTAEDMLEGWSYWAGTSKPPLNDGYLVDVRLRNGDVDTGVVPSLYQWGHLDDRAFEIVAWRIATPKRQQEQECQDPALAKATAQPWDFNIPYLRPGTIHSTLKLPAEAQRRKEVPIATGFIDYFPRAIAAVAELSRIGNEQHNPGSPLHWDRSKSGDESDALMRHFLERGTIDTDGQRHSVKVAWRAMALLEKELESLSGEG
jgi:hypothetical protein